MIFLFPSDYFNFRKVDAAYLEQFNCVQNAGLATSIISLESLGSGSPKIIPIPTPGSKVIYRGWMLRVLDYQLLVNALESIGASALTSSSEYLEGVMHFR